MLKCHKYTTLNQEKQYLEKALQIAYKHWYGYSVTIQEKYKLPTIKL